MPLKHKACGNCTVTTKIARQGFLSRHKPTAVYDYFRYQTVIHRKRLKGHTRPHHPEPERTTQNYLALQSSGDALGKEYMRLLDPIRSIRDYVRLPASVKTELRKDRQGLSPQDPGIDPALTEAAAWLYRAQDNSASRDGGVARHFSLVDGWSPSYPETTGYIVPTMLALAESRGDETARERARRMLDWLLSIQLPGGGFQGGVIGAEPVVPVTFNTGQILIGLAAGARHFGEGYREAMGRAADWLVETQDSDGAWRKNPTPFAEPGEKAYETHVAWGLLEAARVEPSKGYKEAALANVRWALSLQRDNGWFDKCCLTDPSKPLTHTLGYVLRGVVEAYDSTHDASILRACRKTADGLLGALREDGFLPGRLDAGWKGAARWACLTGSVQVAYCWLALYQITGDTRYRDGAFSANRYVRRTMDIEGAPETRGAIKGSFPVSGEYCTYQYPNWACKFFIDSNLLEKAVREG